MTREEVLEEVKNYETYPNGLSKECRDYIIKALETTTKNGIGVSSELEKNSKELEKDFDELDCVSRKAVLEITAETGALETQNRVKALPSVTPQEPKWIPVSERLPEERLGVLVWCPTRKNIYCACYEEKQWWIFGAYWEKVTEEIVAWRPLPTKPYSEVEESEDT